MRAFRPIRPYYRDKMKALIPQYPRMVLNERGDAMNIDWSFIDRITAVTPEQHLPDLQIRIDTINQHFARMLPRQTELTGYCGTQSQVAERLVNGFLVRYDTDRKRAGLATFSDMIRHELGIEACHSSFDAMT